MSLQTERIAAAPELPIIDAKVPFGDRVRTRHIVFGSVALAGAIIVAVGYAIPPVREQVAREADALQMGAADKMNTMFFDPNSQEEQISAALSSLNYRELPVRCAPIEFGNPRVNASGKSIKTYGFHPGMDGAGIRLLPEVCDGIMLAADREERFEVKVQQLFEPPVVDEASARDKAAEGLFFAAHELAHERTPNESQASCVGVQLVDDLAEALGASHAVGDQLQSRAIDIWTNPDFMEQQYLPDHHCRNDGAYDLHPEDPYNGAEFPR